MDDIETKSFWLQAKSDHYSPTVGGFPFGIAIHNPLSVHWINVDAPAPRKKTWAERQRFAIIDRMITRKTRTLKAVKWIIIILSVLLAVVGAVIMGTVLNLHTITLGMIGMLIGSSSIILSMKLDDWLFDYYGNAKRVMHKGKRIY
jgi:hypothetical protein